MNLIHKLHSVTTLLNFNITTTSPRDQWVYQTISWLVSSLYFQPVVSKGLLLQWASYQIRKIAGCACAGNAGNVFPRRRFQRKLLVSDPGMHHGTCVTHVPWCMSGSLTCGDGENVPGIPSACAPAILRIWQEAHGQTLVAVDRDWWACPIETWLFCWSLWRRIINVHLHSTKFSEILCMQWEHFHILNMSIYKVWLLN